MGLGHIKRQVAENDFAAGIVASARNDDGRLVAVRGGDHSGVLSTSTDGGCLGAGSVTATTSTASSLVSTTGSGLLRSVGDDLRESCKLVNMKKKDETQGSTAEEGQCVSNPGRWMRRRPKTKLVTCLG